MCMPSDEDPMKSFGSGRVGRGGWPSQNSTAPTIGTRFLMSRLGIPRATNVSQNCENEPYRQP